MRNMGMWGGVLWLALLAGCDRKEVPAPPAAPAAAPAPEVKPQEPARTGSPDLGGVTKVSREVEAVGSTQELAVVAALQSAVAQVNGVRVASQLQGVRAGLAVSVDGRPSGSVDSQAWAQTLIAASQGAVTGFEILSQEEIDKIDEKTVARVKASDGGYSYTASGSASFNAQSRMDAQDSASPGGASGGQAQASASASASMSHSENLRVDERRGASAYESDLQYQKMRSYWKVRVRVEVAQYRAPEEQGMPRIVVAMPKTTSAHYAVGDGRVNADEVAYAVRGRLSDILTQTRRFVVLDREFGQEMQAEIDHIQSGQVRVEDAARLGQQWATDLILVPVIERFEYVRSVRSLRMSDRQLVSYAGGGRITLRLLNAATGAVVMSDSFQHELASADPSTLPRVVNARSMTAQMMDALSGQIGRAIVTEIFPVTVVAMNGDQVVLSQGGESLTVGQRWQAVYLGEELKDPQTGRSLGRLETPIGTVRIDRVSSQTSYGTLEEGAGAMGDRTFQPGALALRQIQAVQTAKASAAKPAPAGGPAAAPRAAARPTPEAPVSQEAPAPAPAARTTDDRW